MSNSLRGTPMTELDLASYAAERHLREATVGRLESLTAGDRQAVLGWAVPLGLNDNQLRDVLDLLDDIAARRGCDVAAILADPALEPVRRRDIGRSDRIRELKGRLRRLRYPQLSTALDRIDELRRALQLPSGVRLEIPDDLEGDEVTVKISASSVTQLRSRVAAAARSFERCEADAVFSILHEGVE